MYDKNAFPLSVGLLAHVDAGKTTLSESMLGFCGVLRKLGRVDDGSAFLDTEKIEKERGITVYSKTARLNYKSVAITIVDTPGHADFGPEMERVLSCLDLAILIVSAPDGVEPYTRLLHSLLKIYNVPTFIFINKSDRVDTVQNVLSQLNSNFENHIIDFTDIFSDRAGVFEEISMCDDDLLNSYLEKSTLTDEQISQSIEKQKFFPCIHGSALKNENIDILLECIYRFAPRKKYSDKFGARVYKITRENGVRLTHLKITGGTLNVKDKIITDTENEIDEKVNEIRLYSGSTYEQVSSLAAGNICAVTGLNNTHAGDLLSNEAKHDSGKPKLEPMLLYSVFTENECDVSTLLGELKILNDESPDLNVDFDCALQEIRISVMGKVQLEIIEREMLERFNRHVKFKSAGVLYKETITRRVIGCGHFEPLKHYAEVHLSIEPTEAGKGLVFDSTLSVSTLPKNFQHQILSSLRSKKLIGVTGFPITDMKITLIAGRKHEKHTEGGDFYESSTRALRQGLMEARQQGAIKLLEPYYSVDLSVPVSMLGRAINDIEKMNGKTDEYKTEGDFSYIKATVPVTEIQDYQRELNSYTRGEGHILLTPLGYFPCHNEKEVLSSITYNPEADTENPVGSIFCSHGAGHFVPWNEAKKNMHLEVERA